MTRKTQGISDLLQLTLQELGAPLRRRCDRMLLVILLLLPGSACSTMNSSPDEQPVEFPPEVAHLQDAFEATRLPFVGIAARAGETDRLASKFCGEPYWPNSLIYPTDLTGEEMMLLAQINFAEVPPLGDFPQQGILQFFISAGESDEQIWGMAMSTSGQEPFDPDRYFDELQRPDFFRVVYHAPPFAEDDLRTQFPVFADDYPPITGEAQMLFSSQSEVVIPVDYRFEQLFGKSPWDFFAEIGPAATEQLNRYYTAELLNVDAKLGGYANLVQEDRRAIAPEEDWVVLLWIDSFYAEEGVEALWGDAGTALFSIRRADLRQLKFNRVLYSWDSH